MQIKTKNLTHIFDKGGVTEHKALDDATVTITEGEYISVIGQTGSGKTTFIEHLNALLLPTNGSVELTNVKLIQKDKYVKEIARVKKSFNKKIKDSGENKTLVTNLEEQKNEAVKKIETKREAWLKEQKFKEEKLKAKRELWLETHTDSNKKLKQIKSLANRDFIIENSKRKLKDIKSVRKQVGIVFQFAEYQLFEETIEKDIIFGPVTMGIPKEDAKALAKKYIKLVGMDESYLSRSPFSLSGGQKRRVALAGILAMEPEVMIFDEPTAGLDPQGEIETYEIFEKLHKAGKTILIVTHNLDHALQYTNRTIMFRDGKVVADGKAPDVLYNQKLLEDNYLAVPKLVDLVLKLEAKGKKIGKVTSIENLVTKLK